jgi:hypothetical protein
VSKNVLISTLVSEIHNFDLVGIQCFWYLQLNFLADLRNSFRFFSLNPISGSAVLISLSLVRL